MDRSQFSGLFRGIIWILIIAGFFIDIQIFNISLFWILLPLIFLRGPIVNWIYGPPANQSPQGGISSNQQSPRSTTSNDNQQNSAQHQQVMENAYCPQCGNKIYSGANFCEECGLNLTKSPANN